MRRQVGELLFLNLAVLLTAAGANASPITYIETVTGSGSFDRIAFRSELITITVTADTSNITTQSPGFLALNDTSATVSVAGGGTGTFTDVPMSIFTDQTSASAGFNDGPEGNGFDVLDVANPIFASYNLTSSLGPISGSPTINGGFPFATTFGLLEINTTSGNATFQAITAITVPEPSCVVLLGLGAMGLFLGALRQRTG